MSDIKFQSNEKKILSEFKEKAEKAMMTIGMMAESAAKQLSPVDTGLLRNSITFALGGQSAQISDYSGDDGKTGSYSGKMPEDNADEVSVTIGTNVEYAPYIELGHRTVSGGWVNPQEFLRPAIENNMQTFKTVIETEMKR